MQTSFKLAWYITLNNVFEKLLDCDLLLILTDICFLLLAVA